MCFARAALVAPASLLVMVLAASASAGPRLYTGSLVIDAFGNDTSTGVSPPFRKPTRIGIPLTGRCHTGAYHPKETLSFPTYSVSFTVPAYGGAMNSVDTNGDTIPDIPSGCGAASRKAGDPLSGVGPVNTTGATTTSRTPNDPRGFTLPRWALRKTRSDASFERYGVNLWEVHFADLHNATGAFAKSGGDGSFVVTHPGPTAQRGVVQRAGKNRFGGVMRLLGSYASNSGYHYNAVTHIVFYDDWLFGYLGHAGQATQGGAVTGGYLKSRKNYYHFTTSGYPGTNTVTAEVFKWTTGTVTVTALDGGFSTILQRKGYDHRTPMGSGAVQLVSPMLTRWVGGTPGRTRLGEASTASIGVLKVTFVPESSGSTMLGAGIVLLALLYRVRRRERRDAG